MYTHLQSLSRTELITDQQLSSNQKTRREGEFATGFSYPRRRYEVVTSALLKNYAEGVADGAGIFGAAPMPLFPGPPFIPFWTLSKPSLSTTRR
jgi:hypothetical protein